MWPGYRKKWKKENTFFAEIQTEINNLLLFSKRLNFEE
jgi:hypothetical protein